MLFHIAKLNCYGVPPLLHIFCMLYASLFPFLSSREVVQSLIDEYRACESPEYANYGGSYDNTQLGEELEVPATSEAVPSAM